MLLEPVFLRDNASISRYVEEAVTSKQPGIERKVLKED